MRRVKTFCVGTIKGLEFSFERLDEKVSELGNVTIHSVRDNVYAGKAVENDNCPPSSQSCCI